MFKPNCVVVLPASELVIKGDMVRAFMEKRLKRNILAYLKHANITEQKIISRPGRMIIPCATPKKVLSALKDCFGLHTLAQAQELEFSLLEDLANQVGEISASKLRAGTFAIVGKSFSKEFKTKKLEEELGGALLDRVKGLKVQLKNPAQAVSCIAFEKKAYLYFEVEKGAGGMPVGSQGRAALLISKTASKKEVLELGVDLLKSGCNLVLVSDDKKISTKEFDKYYSHVSLKVFSVAYAKELYSLGDIRAFFSPAKNLSEANEDSKTVGVKVFAPNLFSKS